MSRVITPPDILRWRKRVAKRNKKAAWENRPPPKINPIRFTSFCPFAYGYSYTVNGKCLECNFCYRQINNKLIRFSVVELDNFIDYEMLRVPIVVSPQCDPMYSETSREMSYRLIQYVLSHHGKIVYKSAMNNTDIRVFDLAVRYKENFLYQPRFLSDTSFMGDVIRKNIASKFSNSADLILEMKRFSSTGCQIIPIFDPVILHINDHLIADLITNILDEIKVDGMILKQLFATNNFRSQLLLYNPESYKDLSVKLDNYHTYDSIHLIEHLSKVFDLIEEKKINLSFCGNNHINKLLNVYNCCQFKDQKIFFRNDIQFMNLKRRKEKVYFE